jgi:hypothetical protein
MSYESESICDPKTSLKVVKEVVELLGYQKVEDGLKVPDRKGSDRKGSYFWIERKDYRSYVGVELDIYKKKGGSVVVTTRSTAARSYWDLVQQNKTLRLLRDLLGGYFTTDAGRNRYWHPEGPPSKPVSSGCYLARWHFNNALIKPRIYLSQRGLGQPNAKPDPTGLWILDDMNPRFFSNNLLMPYLFAIWEEYFKASFVAMLRYSNQREAAFKRARLNQNHLEMIAMGQSTIEEALAESLSFQRPSIIASNFKLIDPKFNLATPLRKPYRRRKESLFDTIESYVEHRNEFVHTGNMDTQFSDKKVEKAINDFEVAVDRCYDAFGVLCDFTPIRFY